MTTTKKKVGKLALPILDKHSHINDPKLSDGGGWRDGCAGEGGGSASVTAGAVRCSAWLNEAAPRSFSSTPRLA